MVRGRTKSFNSGVGYGGCQDAANTSAKPCSPAGDIRSNSLDN